MPHSWNASIASQAISLFTVLDAESQGDLAFSGAAPVAANFPTPPVTAHAQGYVFTRQDFEDWIAHSSMAASGIALNQLMSKSQMETYRQVNFVIITDEIAEHITPGVNWRGRAEFSIGAQTNSVDVDVNIDGGGFNFLQTINTTPGSSGNLTDFQTVNSGETLAFRLTPFTGANGTGTAGTAVVAFIPEPPL